MATSPDTWAKMKDTRHKLEKCWETNLDWSLYPESIKEVSIFYYNGGGHCFFSFIIMLILSAMSTENRCIAYVYG